MSIGTCYIDVDGEEIRDGDLLADADELFEAKPKYHVFWRTNDEEWYVENLDDADPYITPLYMVADECRIVERFD